MIGAVIAMQSEADILLNEMQISRSLTVSGKQIHVGKAYGKDVAVCVCGVGKVNAALGAQILISKFDAEKLLNFGVAGGLNETTKLCQVYQIAAAVQFDFDLVQLNGTKMGTLNEYEEPYLPLNELPLSFEKKNLGTADRFNDSHADYKLLTEELNADIRDMENQTAETWFRDESFDDVAVIRLNPELTDKVWELVKNLPMETTEKTRNFMSATFDGASVRITSRALGMRTESSGRFEKGLDCENTLPALLRACELVELLGAGTVCDGIIDEYAQKKPTVTLPLEVERINTFLADGKSVDFYLDAKSIDSSLLGRR